VRIWIGMKRVQYSSNGKYQVVDLILALQRREDWERRVRGDTLLALDGAAIPG